MSSVVYLVVVDLVVVDLVVVDLVVVDLVVVVVTVVPVCSWRFRTVTTLSADCDSPSYVFFAVV